MEMTVSGLTGSPSRFYLRTPLHGSQLVCKRVSAFCGAGRPRKKTDFLHLESCNARRTYLATYAMEASYGGDLTNNQPVIFPRINIRDPYKRLGISREASEDEVQAARNFLIQRYGGHKPSVDAIESAHDKIIMQKFYERKNPKIDIKKKVREVQQSRFVQFVGSRFQTPSTIVIVKSLITFIVLGALTILFPTEEGPTLQVAISLLATMYFIYVRLKGRIRAFLYSAGAFIFSWLFGTFLTVSIIPPLPFVKGLRSFEVTTSLITYVLLWVASTYLK